ncbi:hypothetical protein LO762_00180 [Actinocorallia sp. API 0066]|uniref:hypothetical protein n=1 Tax=Actinocorallia sp. API 0066 TaxID=2896846 RepID=UPI001E290BB8|nr:hypothetical protein [Actinocorallia sp. API 0066]MCD0447619.1 hypothetical protein [Actinocorallia sp. API 0066]
MNAKVTVTAVAGWLFADLLLAFAIVVLGTQEPPPLPTAAPTPTPSPTNTRLALERNWVEVALTLDPDDVRAGRTAAVEKVRRALRAKGRLKGRKAGIVLTFGAQHDGGERYAGAVNRLLTRADPDLFSDVQTRDFALLGRSGGEVLLQIYLFYR